MDVKAPLFDLGQLVITPGALQVLTEREVIPLVLLSRHVRGDWAEMEPDDQKANRQALVDGSRIFTRYTLAEGVALVRIWIITEAKGEDGSRASTCILLPEEY
jgi:hypothetical protein